MVHKSQTGGSGGGGGGGAGTWTGRVVTASGNVTILAGDGIVEIAKTVPATTQVVIPAGLTAFQEYVIKDGSGNAGTYNITLVPSSGTIDGAASFVLDANWESISFYSNGTNIRIL